MNFPQTNVLGRSNILRAGMLVLAYAHTFPAQKHVVLFAQAPSVAEAWKGFGACIAVAFYLVPPRIHARILCAIHRRLPTMLRVAGVLLALAHLVPALDHVPRFVASGAFADGWRGLGALAAATWFILPLPLQSWLLHAAWLSRAARAQRRIA